MCQYLSFLDQFLNRFCPVEKCKRLFSIDCVNIDLFSIFFSIAFVRWESVRFPRIDLENVRKHQRLHEKNISLFYSFRECSLDLRMNNIMKIYLRDNVYQSVFCYDISQSEKWSKGNLEKLNMYMYLISCTQF